MAEAYGGPTVITAEAGISRESLYRMLSSKGNPNLKTQLAIRTQLDCDYPLNPSITRKI